MKRVFFLFCTLALIAACGDDDSTTSAGNNGGGSGVGSDPGSGSANEIDAQIANDDGTTTSVAGSAEESIPEQNYAAVAGGSLVVFLASSDASITSFAVEGPSDAIPGTVSVTGAGPDGTWANVTSTAGIFTSSGGTITVNQCPSAGAVITGSFDVSLDNFMGGTSDLTGTWRATVQADDGSVTCREVSGGGNGTGDGTGGGSCDLETCDGPCCPLSPDVASCSLDCTNGACNPLSPDFNPMDPTACLTCVAECNNIFLDDPACGGPYMDLAQCSSDAGCDDIEDLDEADECAAAACCAEYQAAF